MDTDERQSDDEVEQLLMKANERMIYGDFDEAQRLLDGIDERNARWHFFQGKLYKCKNWTNEARKEFKIATELEPENNDYKKAFDGLETFSDDVIKGKTAKK